MVASTDPPTAEAVPSAGAEVSKLEDPKTQPTTTTKSSTAAETTKTSTEAPVLTKLDTETQPITTESVAKSPIEANLPVSPTDAAPATAAPTAASATATADSNPTDEASSTTSTTAAPLKGDVNPIDFQGDVQTDNKLPSQESLRKLEGYTVLDEDGKSHTFKSLYSGHNVARRVLIIFVRHFFCGNCQEYLRVLSAAITPETLLGLPISTSIAVIGCGNYKLIKDYLAHSNCSYPVYADNTQHLYKELGMIRTLAPGERPAYMQNAPMAKSIVSSIFQGLKQVKTGLVLQMGDQKQVGGEFLFEPASMSFDTPIPTPQDETATVDFDQKTLGPDKTEEKRVTWCHRMRNTRDHAEVPELMEQLGLDGNGAAIQDEKKWAKKLRSRKGTGLSMASQMGRLSLDVNAKGANGASNGDANGNTATVS